MFKCLDPAIILTLVLHVSVLLTVSLINHFTIIISSYYSSCVCEKNAGDSPSTLSCKMRKAGPTGVSWIFDRDPCGFGPQVASLVSLMERYSEEVDENADTFTGIKGKN